MSFPCATRTATASNTGSTAPATIASLDGISDWRRRWREAADKTPTQYAHMFWLNRARGELVIQYWFFYPFNEWLNHHEGDWEHVNVVVSGSPGPIARWAARPTTAPSDTSSTFTVAAWTPTGRCASPASTRSCSSAGARACSGGRASRAAAATRGPRRTRAGAAASVRSRWATTPGGPVRMMPADSFDVVMLPEPSRLDARAHPELSWLRLPFFAGQPRVFGNPPLVDRFGGGKPPRQPARRADWNAIGSRPLWSGIPRRGVPGVGIFPMAFLRSTPSLSLAGQTYRGRRAPGQSRGRLGERRPIVSTAARRPAQFRLPVRFRARQRPARTRLPAGRSGPARRFR